MSTLGELGTPSAVARGSRIFSDGVRSVLERASNTSIIQDVKDSSRIVHISYFQPFTLYGYKDSF